MNSTRTIIPRNHWNKSGKVERSKLDVQATGSSKTVKKNYEPKANISEKDLHYSDHNIKVDDKVKKSVKESLQTNKELITMDDKKTKQIKPISDRYNSVEKNAEGNDEIFERSKVRITKTGERRIILDPNMKKHPTLIMKVGCFCFPIVVQSV